LKIYSVMKSISIASLNVQSKLKGVVGVVNETISNMYIKSFTNIDPNIIKNPILVKEFTVIKGVVTSVSPEVIQNLLMSQIIFIPIVLAFVIIFASQTIASLIASEKENKTLETLMTVPIKRPLIILSKMLASSIMALIISFFYLIGMLNYLRGVSMGEIGNAQTSKVLESIGLSFTPIQYFYLGVLLFLTILASLALSSIIATFAEDTKTAQMYLTPLMILVMVPYFLTFFTSIDNLSLPIKILVYAIPFSYPFIASQKILFGNTSIVFIGVVYLLIFSLVSISIATWIISSDKIFTVRVKRKSFNFLKR
ncbi:MAG: ABC transporter permease, partial [Caldisericaceae bacterium]